MARLIPLPVPVPDTLDALLGYDGEATWLTVHFDARAAEVLGDDGHVPFVLAYDAYDVYTTHRAVAPFLSGYALGGPGQPARHRLVLNRETRTLSVAAARVARAHVPTQWEEPPPRPTGAEIGAILAQWTWRLRTEATPAGQAAVAAERAARPQALQALRAWLDLQGPRLVARCGTPVPAVPSTVGAEEGRGQARRDDEP